MEKEKSVENTKSTDGTIRKIIKMSWPVMVGTILQTLVYTCDLFFVSKLGTVFASAAALGTSAAGVVFVMAALVGAGTLVGITVVKIVRQQTAPGISHADSSVNKGFQFDVGNFLSDFRYFSNR